MFFYPGIRFWPKRRFEQFPYWIPGAIWYNSVEPHSEQIRYYACSAHISALNVVLHLVIMSDLTVILINRACVAVIINGSPVLTDLAIIICHTVSLGDINIS